MTTPAPTPAPAPASDAGKTLGIVGLVLAFLFPLIGLILSIIANNQSKAAGLTNGPAKAGIIISIIFLALGLLFTILWFGIFAAAFSTGNVTVY